MKEIIQTGKSINDAVEAACKILGVGLSDVDWEVLDEGSKGFLGIGARPAKVKVTCISIEDEIKEIKEEVFVKKPQPKPTPKPTPKPQPKPIIEPKASPEPQPQPKAESEKTEASVEAAAPVEEAQSERANLTDEDKADIIKIAVNFLSEVLGAINMNIEFNADFVDNKQIVIEMKGEDMGAVIGKRGQTLDSLQYLTNLVVNRGEYPYMNVTLDTEGYRARRKETLEHLAFNLAKKAKHNRRNVNLEPMNPYERRIIHATLQNDRFVTTYSEGIEPYRYVVIALKNNYSRKNRY